MAVPVQVPRELYPGFANPQVKPPGPLVIDWSHPLAQGLVGCWLLNEEKVVNLVDGGRGVRYDGAVAGLGGAYPVVTREGMAYKFVGNDGDYIRYETPSGADDDPFHFPAGEPMSIVVKAEFDDFTLSNNAIAKYGSASDPFEGEWFFSVNTSAKFLFQALDDGSAVRIRQDTDAALSTGVPYTLGAVMDGGSVDESIVLYVDGDVEPSTGFGNDGGYTAMSKYAIPVSIGGGLIDSPFEDYHQGNMWYAYMWNRELNAADMKAIHDSPYQFLKPAYDLSYLTAAGVGGDVNVSVALKALTLATQKANLNIDIGVDVASLTLTANAASIDLEQVNTIIDVAVASLNLQTHRAIITPQTSTQSFLRDLAKDIARDLVYDLVN